MSKLVPWPNDSSLALRWQDRELTWRELRERTDHPFAPLVASLTCDEELHVATSGTTGVPRWARLRWNGLIEHARCVNEVVGFGPGDIWLNPLQLESIGSIQTFVRALVAGGAVHRADVSRLPDCTHASIVGRMLEVDVEPGRQRLIMVGGGPVHPSLLERALERGLPVRRTYGLTEAGSTVSVQRKGRADADDCGLVLYNVACRVEDGEIQLRGPSLFLGYVNEPERDPSAWYRTGDIGDLVEGRLFVHARRRDRIVSGGKNVSPRRVEAVLVAHPQVSAARVRGEIDASWGQRVVAEIDGDVTAADLRAWCKQRLEPFEVPKEFLVR